MKNRKSIVVVALCLCVMLLFSGCAKSTSAKYEDAKKYIIAGEYDKAITAFTEIDGYEDSSKYLMYVKAIQMAENGQYDLAISTLEALKDFSDSELLAVYYQARQYEDNQNYEQADTAYRSIPTFKDSAERLKNVTAKRFLAAIQAGSYITFGTYPQTAAGTDKTPIEWLVLDRDGNKALLISRYGLDAQPYNTEFAEVTWETCTLRTWLNETFMNKAFTSEEQKGIELTNVDNSKSQGYSEWDTDGGNNTQDKIFLLSYAEANKYFDVTLNDDNNTKSRVEPTAYAIAQGAGTSSSNKTASEKAAGYWWLRSPGGGQGSAACVFPAGSLDSISVSHDSYCVRPALWVNLESEIFQSGI